MKISIIIPVHNRQHLIERSLLSVLNQNYENVEVIVVDDGSTDKTREVVKPFLCDPSVKYVYQMNKGVSSARNLGVAVSSGEWIAFLDSDDEWLPDKLSKQVSYLKENPTVEFVHCEENWIRNGKKVNQPKKYRKLGGNIFSKCLSLCAISPSTVVMSKKLFNRVGGFSENYVVCEDFDLWLKITSIIEVGLIDEFLINKYGGHEDQLSTKYVAMDIFRVRALHNILEIRALSNEQEGEVISALLQKCKILLKGFEKHQNFTHYDEVKSLVLRFDS